MFTLMLALSPLPHLLSVAPGTPQFGCDESPCWTPRRSPLATRFVKYGAYVVTSPFASIGALHLYQAATSMLSVALHKPPSVKPGMKSCLASICARMSFVCGFAV